METGEKVPPTAREELPQIPILFREHSKLVLFDGILCRKRQDNEQTSYQLVPPDKLHSTVLHSLHDDMGHMWVERTLDLSHTHFIGPRWLLMWNIRSKPVDGASVIKLFQRRQLLSSIFKQPDLLN